MELNNPYDRYTGTQKWIISTDLQVFKLLGHEKFTFFDFNSYKFVPPDGRKQILEVPNIFIILCFKHVD